MPTTLPTLTKTIDNAFTHTWYEIRKDAADNILNSTVVWAMLKAKGCFKTQVGGEYITRTVVYDFQDPTAIVKGDLLPMGEKELRTMALWTWRYVAGHVQRSMLDDQKNSGKFRIQSLVESRMTAAKDGLTQNYEEKVLAAEVTGETGSEIQGLNDIVPAFANRATGTYGTVARSNDWWVPKYKQLTSPYEINLVEDMRNLYNTVKNNQEPPDVIIADQGLYEMYESFGLEASQIVKGNVPGMLDLGFETLKFKGADMIYTSNMTANNMLFLNTKWIEVIYDPNYWFEMTEWKWASPIQLERIAHIICAMNIISDQLRRHGRLYA